MGAVPQNVQQSQGIGNVDYLSNLPRVGVG
jgi:hypothetical protein